MAKPKNSKTPPQLSEQELVLLIRERYAAQRELLNKLDALKREITALEKQRDNVRQDIMVLTNKLFISTPEAFIADPQLFDKLKIYGMW